MKKLNLLLFTLIFSLTMASQTQSNTEKDPVEISSDSIYDQVEFPPKFPGGLNGLYTFLVNTITYPEKQKVRGIQGRVVCQFIIGKDGLVRDVKVVKSVDEILDAEAVRVIKDMPPWTPGKQGNENVSVLYTLPIVFKMNDK